MFLLYSVQYSVIFCSVLQMKVYNATIGKVCLYSQTSIILLDNSKKKIMLYFRVRILELREETAEILYLDFGNRETVPTESLLELTPEFTLSPGLAMKVT